MRYIAVNSHRSVSGDGFANTWQIYKTSPRIQRHALTKGLPLPVWPHGTDGNGDPIVTTMGIRLATRKEIRQAKKEHADNGCSLPMRGMMVL
jgi:hypothetical protein